MNRIKKFFFIFLCLKIKVIFNFPNIVEFMEEVILKEKKILYLKFFKRISDIATSLIALFLLSPIIITLIVLLIYINKGKPFFFQERPGKNDKLFTIIKFKTMRDPKNKGEELLNQDERITKIGEFIRNTSLDELMQLINVLKGDMSIVGPRPLLPHYLPLYNEEQAKRHLVKPGITGWAQVNGRNTITWNERFAYDVWYVKNISFNIDFKILLKTVQKVFTRDDIYNSEREETWKPWKGNI